MEENEPYSQDQFNRMFRRYDQIAHTEGKGHDHAVWRLSGVFAANKRLLNWFLDKLQSQEYSDEKEG